MKRGLRFRLALTHLAIAVLAIVAVGVIVEYTGSRRFDSYLTRCRQAQRGGRHLAAVHVQAAGRLGRHRHLRAQSGGDVQQRRRRRLRRRTASCSSPSRDAHGPRHDGNGQGMMGGRPGHDGRRRRRAPHGVAARRRRSARADFTVQSSPIVVGGEKVAPPRSTRQGRARRRRGRIPERADPQPAHRRRIAGVLALLVSLLVSRRITGPLEELTDAAGDVAAGNLDVRVAPRGDDEVAALAAAFNSMADRLARDEQWRRDMTSDLSHELRTPLATIQSRVEALEDGVLPPTPENLRVIGEEVERLGRLLGALRSLNELESEDLERRARAARPGRGGRRRRRRATARRSRPRASSWRRTCGRRRARRPRPAAPGGRQPAGQRAQVHAGRRPRRGHRGRRRRRPPARPRRPDGPGRGRGAPHGHRRRARASIRSTCRSSSTASTARSRRAARRAPASAWRSAAPRRGAGRRRSPPTGAGRRRPVHRPAAVRGRRLRRADGSAATARASRSCSPATSTARCSTTTALPCRASARRSPSCSPPAPSSSSCTGRPLQSARSATDALGVVPSSSPAITAPSSSRRPARILRHLPLPPRRGARRRRARPWPAGVARDRLGRGRAARARGRRRRSATSPAPTVSRLVLHGEPAHRRAPPRGAPAPSGPAGCASSRSGPASSASSRPRVDKGDALRFVAAHLGVPLDADGRLWRRDAGRDAARRRRRAHRRRRAAARARPPPGRRGHELGAAPGHAPRPGPAAALSAAASGLEAAAGAPCRGGPVTRRRAAGPAPRRPHVTPRLCAV